MTRPGWTKEEDDRLVDGINAGLSYRDIAVSLSVGRPEKWKITRNGVAGRKARLLVAGAVMIKPDQKALVTHANKMRAKIKARKEKKAVIKQPKPTPPPPTPKEVRIRNPSTGQLRPADPAVLPMTENPKTILELGRRQCRAAVGVPPRMYEGVNNPFLFCGAPTEEGETYCSVHAPIMYKPSKPLSERGFILQRLGTNKGAA